MNVVVCVKQIPDPAAPGALDPATNTLKRARTAVYLASDESEITTGQVLSVDSGVTIY